MTVTGHKRPHLQPCAFEADVLPVWEQRERPLTTAMRQPYRFSQ